MPPKNVNFDKSLLSTLLVFFSVLLLIVTLYSASTTLPVFLEGLCTIILGGLMTMITGRDGKRQEDPVGGTTTVNQVSTTRRETVSAEADHET